MSKSSELYLMLQEQNAAQFPNELASQIAALASDLVIYGQVLDNAYVAEKASKIFNLTQKMKK